MNRPADDLLLTDVELELMTILWRVGRGTTREVMAELPEGRELAVTSVSTMLRILEGKGWLDAAAEGRSHVYAPTVTKAAYEARNLRHLVGHLFEGKATHLVRRLVDAEKMTDAELRALRDLFDSRVAERNLTDQQRAERAVPEKRPKR